MAQGAEGSCGAVDRNASVCTNQAMGKRVRALRVTPPRSKPAPTYFRNLDEPLMGRIVRRAMHKRLLGDPPDGRPGSRDILTLNLMMALQRLLPEDRVPYVCDVVQLREFFLEHSGSV